MNTTKRPAAFSPRNERAEGDPERHRRQRITEVMDQIGEQGDRVRRDEDQRLLQRRHTEHGEADQNRPHPVTRAGDRPVYEPVRMPVPTLRVIVIVRVPFVRLIKVVGFAGWNGHRPRLAARCGRPLPAAGIAGRRRRMVGASRSSCSIGVMASAHTTRPRSCPHFAEMRAPSSLTLRSACP